MVKDNGTSESAEDQPQDITSRNNLEYGVPVLEDLVKVRRLENPDQQMLNALHWFDGEVDIDGADIGTLDWAVAVGAQHGHTGIYIAIHQENKIKDDVDEVFVIDFAEFLADNLRELAAHLPGVPEQQEQDQ